jgi:hypothetical protein
VSCVQNNKDYLLFLCYNHRKNNDLANITKYLMDDIRVEEKNNFILRVI